MLIADGGGGGSAIPAPPPPPPEPSLKDKFAKNLSGFLGGVGAGGADAAKGLGQLGYDVFIGSSPFVDDKTRQETKARAEARGELYKHPSTLIAAVTQPYRNDIAAGHDERAAGRAVFDIGSLLVGGGVTKAGKIGTAAKATEAGTIGRAVMAETRRRFDREFREGAVRIVRETGKPVAQVARDLRINEGTLGTCVDADKRARGEAAIGGLDEEERAELAPLRKRSTCWSEIAPTRFPVWDRRGGSGG